MSAEKPTFEDIFRDFKLILTCTYQGVGREAKEAPWNNVIYIGVDASERWRQINEQQLRAQAGFTVVEECVPSEKFLLGKRKLSLLNVFIKRLF